MPSTSTPRSTRAWFSTWRAAPRTVWSVRQHRSPPTCSATPPGWPVATPTRSRHSPAGPCPWPTSGRARRTSRRTSSTSTSTWKSPSWWTPTEPRPDPRTSSVRAVTVPEPGGPESLKVADVPDPHADDGEVVLDVAATAVNRADLLQRQGLYPPPPGASDIIGLECSGTVAELGPDVDGWQVGDEVCALLAGGGYAAKVPVPAGQLMPLPEGVDLLHAAALPEVACTVWSNVFMVAGLQAGETLLVHGGAGGIGTFAIQLATALGARVVTTAGSDEKLELCRSLGADVAVNYREQDFVDEVRAATDGRGADVILDNMGAKYLARNLDALAPAGRLVIIGMQGGTKAELDIAKLLGKRGAVIGTTLRARPVEEKSAICASVVEHVWPLVSAGKVRPIVHATYPMSEAADAHRAIEEGSAIGKVLIT